MPPRPVSRRCVLSALNPSTPAPQLPPDVRAALDRLITIAQQPTGQGRRIANFLLAWWNAADAGGFALTDTWGLDVDIRPDVVRLFAHVAGNQHYPDAYGYSGAFDELWQLWRGGEQAQPDDTVTHISD